MSSFKRPLTKARLFFTYRYSCLPPSPPPSQQHLTFFLHCAAQKNNSIVKPLKELQTAGGAELAAKKANQQNTTNSWSLVHRSLRVTPYFFLSYALFFFITFRGSPPPTKQTNKQTKKKYNEKSKKEKKEKNTVIPKSQFPLLLRVVLFPFPLFSPPLFPPTSLGLRTAVLGRQGTVYPAGPASFRESFIPPQLILP